MGHCRSTSTDRARGMRSLVFLMLTRSRVGGWSAVRALRAGGAVVDGSGEAGETDKKYAGSNVVRYNNDDMRKASPDCLRTRGDRLLTWQVSACRGGR